MVVSFESKVNRGREGEKKCAAKLHCRPKRRMEKVGGSNKKKGEREREQKDVLEILDEDDDDDGGSGGGGREKRRRERERTRRSPRTDAACFSILS